MIEQNFKKAQKNFMKELFVTDIDNKILLSLVVSY